MVSSTGTVFNHESSNHKPETLKILSMIKQGQTMKDLPEEYHTKSVHSGAYGRMIYDKPAYTLTTGVKGAEFYDKMRLSSFPGNRVRQEAEEILKGGLANFDVESYKGYKSKFNDIYREEAYALLNVIIEMLG